MPKDNEEKQVWENIQIFLMTEWNISVFKPLEALVKDYESKTYTPCRLVKTLFAYAGATNKPIHPGAAFQIAEDTLNEFSAHTVSRQFSCMNIIFGLEQFHSIYKTESTKSAKIIKDAFEHFLGIDPDTLDKAGFEKLKKKIFDYHNITELLKPDELSDDGQYVLIPSRLSR